MARKHALPWLFVLAPLLTACRREAAVDIAKTGDAVAISITQPGSDKPPCIQEMSVTLTGSDIATTPALWEVTTSEPGRYMAHFVYGQVPPGYTQSGPAPRLRIGARYLVEITGPGFQGGQEFTFSAGDGKSGDAAVN